ncbi:MAG: hypothetical protein HC838_08025 [Spirulinaceae cyanobacterium RM2_2_10]|nr:hypothetical protein [Spirulinaceae cyanobacterium RM2_2_10]
MKNPVRSTKIAIAHCSKPLIFLTAAGSLLFFSATSSSQEHPGCFMVEQDGEFIDLDRLCPTPPAVEIESDSGEEPVLGTGDVQVTLRWSTLDDLDLGVTDPSGERVNYENNSIASGGQRRC